MHSSTFELVPRSEACSRASLNSVSRWYLYFIALCILPRHTEPTLQPKNNSRLLLSQQALMMSVRKFAAEIMWQLVFSETFDIAVCVLHLWWAASKELTRWLQSSTGLLPSDSPKQPSFWALCWHFWLSMNGSWILAPGAPSSPSSAKARLATCQTCSRKSLTLHSVHKTFC